MPLKVSSIHANVRSSAISVATLHESEGNAARSMTRLQSVATSTMNDDARLLADARFNPTNDHRTGELRRRRRGICNLHHEREAHAHIEYVVSFFAEVAAPDQFLKSVARSNVAARRPPSLLGQARARSSRRASDVRYRLDVSDCWMARTA